MKKKSELEYVVAEVPGQLEQLEYHAQGYPQVEREGAAQRGHERVARQLRMWR